MNLCVPVAEDRDIGTYFFFKLYPIQKHTIRPCSNYSFPANAIRISPKWALVQHQFMCVYERDDTNQRIYF
jgi:hypothetical protein